MKQVTLLALALIALGGFCVESASATVFLFDDFESQPVTTPGQELQPPPIGIRYAYNPSTSVEAVNVVESPAIGTKSLETRREGPIGSDVTAVSTAGALVDGNILEVSWNHQLSGGTGHRYNAPMQVSIGYSNGLVGRLAFIMVNDTDGGTYHYTDAFTGQVSTGLQPTIDGWDHLRLVMRLEQFDATFMTGTFDLFISLDGAPEQQVANDVQLPFAQMATAADAEDDLTSLWFRMQHGPFTSNSYYDNLSAALHAAPLLPGDANRDGRVDGEDFLIWQANFTTQEGAIWDDGDFNGDGRVDGEDFLIWQANFGTVAESSAVTPEPGVLGAVMALGGLLMLRRRRARRCVAEGDWSLTSREGHRPQLGRLNP